MIKNELTFIFPYGRSGSMFVHSLLDSHPELICFPPIYSFTLLSNLKSQVKSN